MRDIFVAARALGRCCTAATIILECMVLLLAMRQEASGQVASKLDTVLPCAVRIDGLHHVHRLTDHLWSGSSPTEGAHFAALSKMGIRTVVSVDGAPPRVNLAAQHGLRYVHLPVGYHGLDRSRIAELSRAARVLPGGVYVHCHHGKHRGPAAAAAVCVTLGAWTRDKADEWMRSAGTSLDYRGLYKAISHGKLPTAAEILAVPLEFPATAPPEPLVDAMVQIDELWERLKVQMATPNDNTAPSSAGTSDMDTAAATALLLAERLRELAREEPREPPSPKFVELLRQCATSASELHLSLAAGRRDIDLLNRVQKSCQACHGAFRD